MTVSYTDDTEYRQCIRKVFCLTNTPETKDDIDVDEIEDFHTDAIERFLDNIYQSTHHIDVFQELYRNAAAIMMSEDMSLGLTVLFSYDYLQLFHNVLSRFYDESSDREGFASIPEIEELQGLLRK
jgi:hypothetical protein